MRGDELERVIVIGTSCSGKTTFARRLAQVLDTPHVELDGLYWGPHWTPKPESEFRHLTEAAVVGPRWVTDGNYGVVRDLLWPRATSVVWLNYGFLAVFSRALRRTIFRAVSREELFSGNRESFTQSFLSRKSILVWVVTTFRRNRRSYRKLQASGEFPRIRWREFHRPCEADAFLERLQKGG